mmetsp:Transcript_9403/g.27619  ORF Transcript_9403/g.27619 Transcript_9403/m.27619 type:complete len:280 (+) Transcript_9403:4361-5200(+)
MRIFSPTEMSSVRSCAARPSRLPCVTCTIVMTGTCVYLTGSSTSGFVLSHFVRSVCSLDLRILRDDLPSPALRTWGIITRRRDRRRSTAPAARGWLDSRRVLRFPPLLLMIFAFLRAPLPFLRELWFPLALPLPLLVLLFASSSSVSDSSTSLGTSTSADAGRSSVMATRSRLALLEAGAVEMSRTNSSAASSSSSLVSSMLSPASSFCLSTSMGDSWAVTGLLLRFPRRSLRPELGPSSEKWYPDCCSAAASVCTISGENCNWPPPMLPMTAFFSGSR